MLQIEEPIVSESQLAKGISYLLCSKYEYAEMAFSEHLQDFPEEYHLWKLVAILRARSNCPPEVIQRACEIAHDHYPDAYFVAAEHCITCGSLRSAIPLLQASARNRYNVIPSLLKVKKLQRIVATF